MPDFEMPEDFEEHGLNDPYDFPPGVTPLPKPKANGHNFGAAQSQPLNEFDAGLDTVIPPPRGWLLGNSFCRKFISSLIADGGTGKTALRYAQAIAMATGKPITGEYVFKRARVLVVSLEDDVDELRRRVLAARIYHNVDRFDLRGWLFLSAANASAGKLKTMTPKGQMVEGELAKNLERTIISRKIDVVILDPFVKAHEVEENNNTGLDSVVQILTTLADKHNIAIDIPHHVSKGAPDPGNAQRGRGASSIIDAARLAYTLSPMSSEEAQSFGVPDDDRKQYIRHDKAKINLARSGGHCRWFKLVGVPLDNGNEDYPSGDEVQTVEEWNPPDTFEGLDIAGINQILNLFDRGMADGERFSGSNKAKDRAAWRVIRELAPHKPESVCRRIIKQWLESGLLVEKKYRSEVRREEVSGLFVNKAQRPT